MYVVKIRKRKTQKELNSIIVLHWTIILDGPAIVNVNIFVRSISKIDDVTMVSGINPTLNYSKMHLQTTSTTTQLNTSYLFYLLHNCYSVSVALCGGPYAILFRTLNNNSITVCSTTCTRHAIECPCLCREVFGNISIQMTLTSNKFRCQARIS